MRRLDVRGLAPLGLLALALLVASPWTASVRGDGPRTEEEIRALKQKMKGWARDLGVKCGFCHVKEGRDFDYEADTPKKEIAEFCSERFARDLRKKGGQELTCRDCHSGHTAFLPRPEVTDPATPTPPDALKQVEAACKGFVDKLELKEGGGRVTCAACHGEAAQPGRFLPRGGEGDDDDHDDHDDHEKGEGAHEGGEHRGGGDGHHRDHDDDDD